MFLKDKKPVIISGSPRSGSTWIGRVLEVHKNTNYVHEPFNIGIDRPNNPFKYWMEGVFNEQSKNHLREVKAYLDSFYSIDNKYIRKELNGVSNLNDFRDSFWRYRERRKKTTILKDPIAFFALDWLSKNVTDKIIVTIRHPASVVASLKQKQWGYEFEQMLKQPILMEKYLLPLKSEIEEFAKSEKSIVQQGALQWKCVYYTNLEFMKAHPHWLYVTNENLSLNPLQEFERILNYIDLPITENVKNHIIASTTARKGEETDLVRDSRSNIDKWKKLLTNEEIAYIKSSTEEVWSHYYNESDW
ncbi:MAG: hypothetical protein CMP61_09460 [Flavobacteriales bacterium]|nr:hypothetical protein [Flavobacteriales bacterium]|tara:strand:+ start:1916 stop:2824 length:909 start_codon:yes stop_codon:yes gene_type:complete